MIIFIGEGGLGNQIYQYAFIKNFSKKGELIVTCNFKKFIELFDYNDNIYNINNKYIAYLLRKIFIPIFKLLSKLRVISSIKARRFTREKFSVEGNEYVYIRGFLSVIYIYPGYFQSETMFDSKKIKNLKIKDKYIIRAKSFLADIPKSEKKIFVHIRRGDYQQESALGIPDITLPCEYYRKGIKLVEKQFKNVSYIFMSNDQDYIKKEFEDIIKKRIPNDSDLVDFTIMTLCDGGIISNSSFSWWGAYWCKKDLIIAPKYWFGFKSKIEIPVGVSPSFADLLDVY